jgi:cytochrome c oxidase subunit 2
MYKHLNKLGSKLAAFILLLFSSTYALAGPDYWGLNMHRGVTPLSHDMYDLHMLVMWVCILIGIGVFGVLIFSLIKYRKSKGAVAANFHHNTKVEIIWTLIPCVILILLAIPATKTLIRMDDTEDADVTIKITGHQWKWQYQYLDQGISYFSNISTPEAQRVNKEKKGEWYLLEVDKPLVLPIHKKIRFLVTSGDVIHSWWVPDFGVKRDAIPGFIHEEWAKIEKPGTYRGQCAELCGINHGYMPIVVKAVTQADFDKWVQTAEKVEPPNQPLPVYTMEQLMSKGKALYNTNCSACHQVNGTGMPPTFPALKGSSVAVGHPVSRHIELVLHGVPGTAMQAFEKQLNDKELAAIITYERNAFGNVTGDMVQPQDIRAVKSGENIKPKIIIKKATTSGGNKS